MRHVADSRKTRAESLNSTSVDSLASLYWPYGAVPKWPKGEVCKTSIRGFKSHPRLQRFRPGNVASSERNEPRGSQPTVPSKHKALELFNNIKEAVAVHFENDGESPEIDILVVSEMKLKHAPAASS